MKIRVSYLVETELQLDHPYLLGKAKVYPDRHLIDHHGEQIHLPPKAFALLQSLVQHHDRSVTREELLDQVWGPGRGSDELLNNGISKLRRALGNPGDPASVIETVPKVGYRLNVVPQRAESNPPQRRWNRPLTWALGALLIAAGTIGILLQPDSRATVANPIVSTATKLRGTELRPAFSPDGNQLLFSWVKVGTAHSDLYLQDLASGNLQRLTNDPAFEAFATWHSDGNQFAYVKTLDGSCELVVLVIDGSDPSLTYPCDDHFIRSLSWMPNGDALLVAWTQEDGSISLHRLNPASGEHTPFIASANNQSQHLGRFSPAGDRLAWIRTVDEEDTLVVRDLGSGQEQSADWPDQVADLHWSLDGDELDLSVGQTRRRPMLQRVRLAELNEPHALAVVDGEHRAFSVHPKTGAIAFDQFNGRQQLLLINRRSGEVNYQLESSFRDEHPVVSADSNYLSFRSDRSGAEGLWLRHSDGTTEMLFDQPDIIAGHTWSVDESAIIYSAKFEGRFALHWYDVATGNHKQLSSDQADLVYPTLDRQGRYIYLRRDDGEAQQGVRFDLLTHQIETIVDRPVLIIKPSMDGQWVYFTESEESGLWRKRIDGDDTERFLDDLNDVHWGNWTVTDDGIIYRATDERGVAITSVNSNGEAGERIYVRNALMRSGPNFAFDPESQTIVVTTSDNYEGNIQQLSFGP